MHGEAERAALGRRITPAVGIGRVKSRVLRVGLGERRRQRRQARGLPSRAAVVVDGDFGAIHAVAMDEAAPAVRDQKRVGAYVIGDPAESGAGVLVESPALTSTNRLIAPVTPSIRQTSPPPFAAGPNRAGMKAAPVRRPARIRCARPAAARRSAARRPRRPRRRCWGARHCRA